MELHRVDCVSSHGMVDNYDFVQRKREEFAAEPLIPPPLINGEDLKKLGMKPGPKFKEILDAVSTRQLEGTLRTSEEALAWVRSEGM
jgi:poly(A) polymerase